MKHLTLFLVVFTQFCFGQITLENTYTSPYTDISVARLNNTLTVYQSFNSTNNQITLFNQNHSIYKTITIPTQPGTYGFGWNFRDVSQLLFNTDNLIEYVVTNTNPPINMANNYLYKIYNETGTVIFQKDSIDAMGNGEYIFNSPAGTKLFLSQITNTIGGIVKHVYSLPGTLFLKVNELNTTEDQFKVYPNPSQAYFRVEYSLPKNVNEGLMEILDMNGKLVKSYRISNQMNDILIDSDELSSGTYNLKITANDTTVTNKIIKL